METEETRQRLDQLSDQARTLTDGVRALTATAEKITKRTRRSEMVIAGLVVSFVLDIVLTLFVAFGLSQLNKTTEAVQQTQANGAVIREKVLCPLYQLIIASYSTQVRDNPALNPHGAAWYDNAFATMRSGASAMHCPSS